MSRVKEVLAGNIRRIRGRREMTVRELSAELKRLGLSLSPSGVSEVENATRKVSVDELLVIAIALNASVIDLLYPLSGEALSLADGVEPLTPEFLERWLQGEFPWPPVHEGGDTAERLMNEFLSTASEYRRAMHRLSRRPEVASVEELKQQVTHALRMIENSDGAEAEMFSRQTVLNLQQLLRDVDKRIDLLVSHLEKKAVDIEKCDDGG